MLNNIEIRNFRGIKHLTIDNLKNINIFLGKANTGKTTVVEAIACGIAKNVNSLILLAYLRDVIKDDDIFESLFYDYNINIPILLNTQIDNNNYKVEISPYKQVKEIIISNNATEEIYNSEINSLSYKISNNGKNYNSSISYTKKDKNINIKLNNVKLNINDHADFISSYMDYDLSNNLKSILSNNQKKNNLNPYILNLIIE